MFYFRKTRELSFENSFLYISPRIGHIWRYGCVSLILSVYSISLKKFALSGLKPFIEVSVIYHHVPKEGMHHIK